MTEEAGMNEAVRRLSESLRRLMDNATNFGRSTLDSVQDSLHTEERRHIAIALGACAMFVLLTLGGLFAGVAIILAYRDTNPALAAAAVAGGFLLLAGVLAWYVARRWRQRPKVSMLIGSLAPLLFQYFRSRR